MGPYGNLIAAAQVSAAGALVGESFGIEAAPVLAASVYTFTLSNDIDRANVVATAIPIAPAAGRVIVYTSVNQTADGTVTVSTFNAADAPTNGPFQLEIRRMGVR